jgi:N-acetylmuramoyl-L-alanine amidase
LDGSIEKGRSIHTQGAHVQGHNKDNIGICLIGGLNASGNPSDTFTEEQWGSLSFLLKHLTDTFGIVSEDIKGHRDWPNVKKDCPCFNVKDKLGYLLK